MFYIYPRNVIIIAHAYDFPQAFQFIFFRLRKVEGLNGPVRKEDKFSNFLRARDTYSFRSTDFLECDDGNRKAPASSNNRGVRMEVDAMEKGITSISDKLRSQETTASTTRQ